MAVEKITREKIIRAVLDSAFEKSTGSTSLADISAILGIKKASLYNHYPSREAMIEATTRACGDILKKVNLITAQLDATVEKYPAESVIRGLLRRYITLCEREPIFQAYVYIESQKFFDSDANEISSAERARLTTQCFVLLKSFLRANKIREQGASQAAAIWLASGVRELTALYLLERKEILREHPLGENSLFEAPSSDPTLKKIEALVSQFVKFSA